MTTPDDMPDDKPTEDANPQDAAAPDYDAMAKRMLDDWQARWKETQLPEQLQQVQTQWQQMIQPALEIGQNFWQQILNPAGAAPQTEREEQHDAEQPVHEPDVSAAAAEPDAKPVEPAQPATTTAAPAPAAPAAAAPAAGADLRPAMGGTDGTAVNAPAVGPQLAAELSRRMDGLSARILRLEAELDRLRKQQQQ